MLSRHILIVTVLWGVLTAAGLAVVLSFDPFPIAAAHEARIVDDAFTLLTILALPVFSFVIATLLYSVLRFRSRGEPTEDGPPIRSHKAVVAIWFFVTTALTVALIIHPGITGINELRALDDGEPELVVQVEGGQWYWKVTYPEEGVFSRREMVLPVDTHTRFYISAVDVLHSFWIPAFRVKIDAVPGLITTTSATPDKTGDFDMDANFRVQCAELCGLAHAKMSMPLRVVERSEFDAWISEQTPVR